MYNQEPYAKASGPRLYSRWHACENESHCLHKIRLTGGSSAQ